MAIIAMIDGPNRDIYLHADTMNTEVHPIDIYKEMRTFRRTDENLRKYDLFLKADGYVSKGDGKFTPILVTCLLGTRIIPYDGTHVLTITGEIITDEGTSGVACFDRSSLGVGVEVDINYVPPQVEVIEVAVGGSSITVADIWNEVLSAASYNIAGSAGKRLRQLGDVVDGSVNDPGATTSKFITNLTENRDDFYKDQIVRFTSGNLEGYTRPVLFYNGTTKEITVSETMIEAPDNGIDFDMIPTHVHPLEEIGDTIWQYILSGQTEEAQVILLDTLKKAKLAAYKL